MNPKIVILYSQTLVCQHCHIHACTERAKTRVTASSLHYVCNSDTSNQEILNIKCQSGKQGVDEFCSCRVYKFLEQL